MRKPFLPLILIAASLAPTSFAATLHVSHTGDGADGLTWPTAFPTISEALLNSASGDHIWVAAGVYTESIQMVTGVHLYGGFAGTESLQEVDLRDRSAFPSVIDAGLTGNRVAIGADGVVLNGFILKGGLAERGGGLACFSSDMVIRDCTFTQNSSYSSGPFAYGGGIYSESSHLTIFNSAFLNNSATIFSRPVVPGVVDCFGGGLCSLGGKVEIYDSLFRDNNCNSEIFPLSGFDSTPGVGRGAGMFASGSAFVISSTFEGNRLGSSTSGKNITLEGGGCFFGGEWLLADSLVRSNALSAFSSSGSIDLRGPGIAALVKGNMESTAVYENWDVWGYAANGRTTFEGGEIWIKEEHEPTPTVSETPIATATPTPIVSDIDGDEKVNWADLFLLQQDWLKEASAEQVYKTDLNEDEWVDAFDLLILLNDWRSSR